jgi:Ca2+-binding RTX toxin-like protein
MKTALQFLAVVAVAGVPGVASAATVSSNGSTVTYNAASHEVNSPALLSSFPTLTFSDATAPLTAGAGCVAGPPVSCAGFDLVLNLGDKADTTNVNNNAGNTTIDGGSGSDDLEGGSIATVTVTGGDGNDALTVNANSVGTGHGGTGTDTLLGTSASNQLTGDDGADLITNRGSRFSASTLDGGIGNDRIVGNGIAALVGGAGFDILVAQGDGESIDGGGASDNITSLVGGSTITAGGSNDQIDAADGTASPDTVSCGSGSDTVWADAGDSIAADCETVIFGTTTLPGTTQAIADAAAL